MPRLVLFVAIPALGLPFLWSCNKHYYSSITRDEYDVYSAFFNQWHYLLPPADGAEDKCKIEVEVAARTMSYSAFRRGDDKAVLVCPSSEPFKAFDESVYCDYVSKSDAVINFRGIDVTRNIRIKPVDLLDRLTPDGLFGMTLSRVGISRNRDLAVFWVSLVPGNWGVWIVLKFQLGCWQIIDELWLGI